MKKQLYFELVLTKIKIHENWWSDGPKNLFPSQKIYKKYFFNKKYGFLKFDLENHFLASSTTKKLKQFVEKL